MSLIKLTGITKRYRMGDETVFALDHVSMAVEPNEFVAIVGPSGSGKSTLMNIIGCLDAPDEGEYILDGENVSALPDRELSILRNRKIGFVFHISTCLASCRLSKRGTPSDLPGVRSAMRKEMVTEVMEKVGLTDRLKHRPNQLSGGQKQRVAIARALVTRPSLILADEPTGNLDSKSGREVMDTFHHLHQMGNTILLITHNNRIAAEAQRMLSIQDGKVTCPEDYLSMEREAERRQTSGTDKEVRGA